MTSHQEPPPAGSPRPSTARRFGRDDPKDTDSAYLRIMFFDIGVGEALVLILLPLVILAAIYWVVRTAARHGKQDAERDRVSVVHGTGTGER
jgi:hypothetical protein